ncbi:ergosteryl-3beta-O-L-aspartate synthase [Microdochium nivale]|nr:ergosteryl-3beta-O-L-aspartate synthase [Microdochium nivale]
MTSFKKPLLALNRLVGHSTAKNHMSKLKLGKTENLQDERRDSQLKQVYEKTAKKSSEAVERKSMQAKRKQEDEERRAAESPEIQSRYGSKDRKDLLESVKLEDLDSWKEGETLRFTARIHHVRNVSAKLAFILLRQRTVTVQSVLTVRENAVTESFVRWAEHLKAESIVYVEAVIKKAPETIKTCNVHDYELQIESMHVIVEVDEALPIDVYGIDQVEENPETKQVELRASNRMRTTNRIAYLRTPTMQSVFRIQSTVTNIFRSVLNERGFTEIHTPKLQPAATESGASVFPVKYFGRTAYLAQSPQLAKQMCISADFERVFEIGPVFRAEDSNTHRHLTEYTGLDFEMAIDKHYHEALDMIDAVFKAIFTAIYSKHSKELDLIKTRFPHEDLVWLDHTPRLTFKEAITLLNESGWTDDDGKQALATEDLSTRAEIRVGELVKEKFGTDYYIIDKFPASARPFYTHLDDDDAAYTNSFDIFLRGQEIVSGGQRIHEAAKLAERMRKVGVDPRSMEEYFQGFEWGAPPHAGCGVGLERFLFLMLNLGDIRNASLYPRDPKSLQPRKTHVEEDLPHPEADTIKYAFEGLAKRIPLPSVEDLIANYGDATNTSWLDDRYTVWRHEITGAAIGYAKDNGYALIMGNPLCDARQYPMVMHDFLHDLTSKEDLRPLWLLVSPEVEEILSSKLGWRSLACVGEERVAVEDAISESVAKKEKQAKKADVKIRELGLGEDVPADVRARIDERIKEWEEGRKNSGRVQVHITDVRPWVDMAHRRYLWAEDKEGKIVAICVLHKLSPANGYQIKFALDFPGSPNGSIEALISKAIQSLSASGVKNVTFGAGAMTDIAVGSNMGSVKAKLLSKTYKTVIKQLKLVQKSEFREKFGAQQEPVFICYPFLGLGVSGTRTLIKFFEDEM